MQTKSNRILNTVIVLVELLVLLLLFFWHLKLGLVRFFDADEFAHLHWGYSFSAGERPYTDFFYLFPPFFLYPIAAIFKIIGRGAIALIYARMFIFVVFLATSGVLFMLAKKLRNIQFGLFAVIIFAFLPLPFDKLIEVRPDIVATFLAMVGLLLFIKAEDKIDKTDRTNTKNKWYFFLSGLSYAASLGFVPKTIFFLIPIIFIISYKVYKSYKDGKIQKESLLFFLGFIPIGVILFLTLNSFGNLSLSLYSITRMASEVTNVLGAKFYMRPDIFFYPNDTYYGFGGWSVPLVINLIIYISASIWAIGRFISSLSDKDDKKCLREFLIGGTFFANLGAFVLFYPLKHAQYLIPVAPFVAFYFADLLYSVIPTEVEGSLSLSESKSRIPACTGRRERFLDYARNDILGKITFISILLFITIIGFQMNQKKVQWVNKTTMEKVTNFLKIIPAGEPVYDLTGESIFFRNGYYFCCLPYGQYEEALYFKIPDIEKDLQSRGTKYVHLGWQKRLEEIPGRHARYIIDNFVPKASDKTLLIKKTD